MSEMSISNFANVLVNDIVSAVENEVRQVAKDALYNAILKTVYLRKKTYAPTYDLLNAVEVSNIKINKGAGIATFEVFVNGGKINPDFKKPWDWNAHGGMSGQPFTDGLVETLDQGISSPVYTHPAYGFFDKAEKDMDSKMVMAMGNALRAKGWNVKIG